MDFIYTTDLGPWESLLPLKLMHFPCKHVMAVSSEKAQALLDASLNLGYDQVFWGYGEGLYAREGENRMVQLAVIRRMVYKQWMRPFRLVIDKSGTPWIDNLHSAIRDILVFGDDTALSDVGFYVIDLSKGTPVAIDYRGSLSMDVNDILGAVDFAVKRDLRADDAVRAVGYSIGDFFSDNCITRDALRLSDGAFHNYQLAYYKQWKGVRANGVETETGR